MATTIPGILASILDEELAAARVRIGVRIAELFGGVPVPALGSAPFAAALPAGTSSGSGRHRSTAAAVEALQGDVWKLFKRKGDELGVKEVQRALGIADRHRISRALRALAAEGKLRLLGERGGARYARK